MKQKMRLSIDLLAFPVLNKGRGGIRAVRMKVYGEEGGEKSNSLANRDSIVRESAERSITGERKARDTDMSFQR